MSFLADQRSGLYPVPLPYVLGVDGAGHIAELGSDVAAELGLKVGAAVAYSARGTYAEWVVTPADRVILVPDGLDLGVAVAAVVQGMTAVALATLAHDTKAGDWVLVHAAAGGTGSVLVQVAAARGAHVIGVTSTEEKAALAKQHGAEHVLLSGQPDLAEAVLQLTGGRGVDVVYDGVGAATWDISRKALKLLGLLVSFGNASGKVPPIELAALTPRNIKVMRPSLFEFINGRPSAFKELADTTFDLVTSGKVKLQVQKVYKLEEASVAHRDIEARKTIGKLLLDVTA